MGGCGVRVCGLVLSLVTGRGSVCRCSVAVDVLLPPCHVFPSSYCHPMHAMRDARLMDLTQLPSSSQAIAIAQRRLSGTPINEVATVGLGVDVYEPLHRR